MKKLLIVLAIFLMLTSCASFKEFSDNYDKVDAYLMQDGDYVDFDDLKSSIVLGQWQYNSLIYNVSYVESIELDKTLLEDEEAQVTIESYNLSDEIRLNNSIEYFDTFINKFSSNSEKGKNLIHLIKMNEDKITMGKLELGADGSQYIIVRTLLRVDSTISYTVGFDSNGGSSIESEIYSLGEKVSKPLDPTKEGYTFDAWYSGATKFEFNERYASSLLLKAKWNAIVVEEPIVEEPIIIERSVDFETNGGSLVESIVVSDGEVVSKPEDPIRENYTFVGWVLDNEDYDFSQVVSSDIVLTASWAPIIYEEDFFDTKFYYSQCKDVQWNVSQTNINVSGPQMLYSAQKSRKLSENTFDDGAYVKFDKIDENGYFSQSLYSKNGDLIEVLSNKGTINYFGEYGFLYMADSASNNANNTYCTYFYTNKALNSDGSTPNRASYTFVHKIVKDESLLNSFN